MKNPKTPGIRSALAAALSLLAWRYCGSLARANPAGGAVTQGAATITSSGTQLTVNVTTPHAAINWQTFNIGAGETTTFVQPSASSVVWNQINDANPSQILGSLNANGYVILQNQNGISIGGQAAITAHGLVMTTSATPPPNLSGGGAWTFNAPPLGPKIINYGQINITGAGSAYLIANDIENQGTISAPGGKIGLYAGEQVLLCPSPDGLALSTPVTLPQGSVDNEGKLIADAGTIAAQAQTVNQNGLVQANSVRTVNGVVELVASDSLTLGAASDIEAHGDNTAANTAASTGGFVVLQAGTTFTDTASSTINVAGSSSAGGGVAGIVEVFGNNLTGATSIQSQIDGGSAAEFSSQNFLLVNPYDITLSISPTGTFSSPPTATAASVPANLSINDLANYTRIDLHALNNLELQTAWTLADSDNPATLNLSAGNSIILDDGSSINAGNNWGVNLTAGTGFTPTPTLPVPASGSDGIYLNGSAYVSTENGDINLWAANEVQIATGSIAPVGDNGIRTLEGGNIYVTTVYGDVNTGANPQAFDFNNTAPYATPSTVLGGISTAAGGNVIINAGGDVTSFLPSGTTSDDDAGTGAFGPQPGNVTINAGGSVYGHYVLANGMGTITAGVNAGNSSGAGFALSLIEGTWNVNAPDGSIYLQEVRNPNGIFNITGGDHSAGSHLFDYGPRATVNLNAGLGVYLTGLVDNLPRPSFAGSVDEVQVIYPPILNITAGAGGVNLLGPVTLFPSAWQNLSITTTGGGNLTGVQGQSTATELLMSDSSHTSWNGNPILSPITPFSDTDHSTGVPVQAANPDPVVINISGDMKNLNLVTSKATQLIVGGNMIDCGFSGQNLAAGDITSLTVGGAIQNPSSFSSVSGVSIPAVPFTDLLPGMSSSWNNIFTLAVNPALLANVTITPTTSILDILQVVSLFGISVQNNQVSQQYQNFHYDVATQTLAVQGQMSQAAYAALGTPGQPLYVLHLVNGQPAVGANGQLVLDQVNWAAPSVVDALYTASQNAPPAGSVSLGYRIGGPGYFDITAGSMDLGDSSGILSCGVFDPQFGLRRYTDLASITPSGATVNVTVTGNLTMLSSTIATLGGGDVNVTSTGGSIDLGLQELAVSSQSQVGSGIFTAGAGNVHVTAASDIDIDGSRIGTFNGGDIVVESLNGSVNVGSGTATFHGVYDSFVNTAEKADYYFELVYGSGIVAETLVPPSRYQTLPPNPATQPGNITVEAPKGNIIASLGGITQEALDGNTAAGPVVTLIAGTLPTPANNYTSYPGNIDLGQSGVIGGTVNANANGNITGLIISRQNSTVVAAQNVNASIVSGGVADVSGGGSVSGVIVGIGGANVSGGSISASLIGQNVSVNGGASQSTLGATATATSTAQAAANQSETQAGQQLANDVGTADDDKKKNQVQTALRRVKRVTIILPDKT
jgi:filamentous hemagglutinin family protein